MTLRILLVAAGIALGSTGCARTNSPADDAFTWLSGSNQTHSAAAYYVVFYVDTEACLPCEDDLDVWRRLDTSLARVDASLVILTSPQDSADVAIAMELERIKAPVRVVHDTALVDQLSTGTVARFILDSTCHIAETLPPVRSPEAAHRMASAIEAYLCP